MKLYIAGPMTGLPGLNFPAFHEAATILRGVGHTVVNPAELNVDPDMSWQDCMRTDIRELVTCDSIVLLPNWIRSRGARLEFHIASELGIGAIEWNTWAQARPPFGDLHGHDVWFSINLPQPIKTFGHMHCAVTNGDQK